jgi:hypothetical protein
VRAVSEGLATTFGLLATTDNEAAVGVLIAALDSSRTTIQEGALAALLSRRSTAGHREIFRRFPTLSPRWQEVIRQYPGRMVPTLRVAVLGADVQSCRNACQAAVAFREYDLIPALLSVLEDHDRPNADLAAGTLMDLVGGLYEELAGSAELARHRDPQLMRQRVVEALEDAVERFGRHKRREVIEAFLTLAARDNAILRHILENPYHVSFLVAVEVLSRSHHAGVLRLLLSFLDDPQAPSAALSVLANRTDLGFVRCLLRKIGRAPAAAVTENLKRIESIAWLRSGGALLEQLDEAAQHGTVRLAMRSGIARSQAFSTIESLLLRGKPAGRREAARALAEFNGAAANALALRALDDPDPQVQASIVVQLRARGIPGLLSRLVKLVDSRHLVVRNAARQSLTEFTFQRFVGVFDTLDEEVRHSTGLLVKKVDPQAIPRLREELESPLRRRRLRGLAMAEAMEAVEPLEATIVALLENEDHVVRAAAATALAGGITPVSREALERALGDRSEAVQEAARSALRQREHFTRWRNSAADPRD